MPPTASVITFSGQVAAHSPHCTQACSWNRTCGFSGLSCSAPAGQAAFFTLYYVMTGLHALHVVAGAAVLAWLAWRLHTGALDARRAHVLSNGALYWHLVDCVWIVLWPLFYLTGGQA